MNVPQFQNPILQKIIGRFSRSRDFTISFFLHFLLVIAFGTTVLFKAVQEPSDFEGGEGGIVAEEQSNTPPAPTQPNQTQTFTVTAPPQNTSQLQAITTTSTTPLDFSMNAVMTPDLSSMPSAPTTTTAAAPQTIGAGMTVQTAQAIAQFSSGWGKKTGPGTGLRQREFEFVAYIGQYNGGNWNSTITVAGDKITKGSLPNLLYFISKWSNGKIKTNDKNVKAIKLDSNELFVIKPPFIFLTGTQDFKLTEKEVENLRKYVQLGGAIWGDSSVPGLRSRFDIAFRREMKRVIPDADKKWESLPKDHPIYTKSYYPEIKDVPMGLNYYQEPIFALRIYGQIAIIYTANDYGDMWQLGVYENPATKKIEMDIRQNERREYVSSNGGILHAIGYNYLHNLDVNSLVPAYKFGTNVIIHLLTRWEEQVSRAPRL